MLGKGRGRCAVPRCLHFFKEFREKKKVQNSITFQFKNEKVPVCRELIGVGFAIDFAVVSVPLGYRKIPLTKISNRIQW